jgi:hypothetical protein
MEVNSSATPLAVFSPNAAYSIGGLSPIYLNTMVKWSDSGEGLKMPGTGGSANS